MYFLKVPASVCVCVRACARMHQIVGKFSVLCLCLQAEADLRSAQSEFDRQSEITKILLEGINSTHVSQIQSVVLSDSALRVKRSAPLLHDFPILT